MSNTQKLSGIALFVLCTALSSCTSKPGTSGAIGTPANGSAGVPNTSGIVIAGEKTYLRDWTGRTSGRPANPDWLGDAEEGNFTKYQAAYSITSGVCRLAVGTGADLKAAQMRADMDFSRQTARTLAQKVSVKAAELSRSGGMDGATAQAIEERTKVQSNAEFTGGDKRTEYYKLLEIEDSRTGKTSREYRVFQVYVFSQDVWDQIVTKYMRSVIGELPQNLKPEQKEVIAMLDGMDYDEHHPVVLDQKQREQKLEAEKRMADAQINLMPAQQEAAAKAELAKLNQEALNDRNRINADARVAMTKAMAEGRVQEAAYLSGDPALQSAAVVTVADAPLITSRYRDMAALILN